MKKITVLIISFIFMLILAGCGGGSGSVKGSAYAGMSDDGATAVYLSISGGGSHAVLCLLETDSGRSGTWEGDFVYDGTTAGITDKKNGTSVIFDYEGDGKEAYLLTLGRYGQILANRIDFSDAETALAIERENSIAAL